VQEQDYPSGMSAAVRVLLGLGVVAGAAGAAWALTREDEEKIPPPGPRTIPSLAQQQLAAAAEPAIRDAAAKANNAIQARKARGLPVYSGLFDMAMQEESARHIRLMFLGERVGLQPRALDAVMQVESGGKRSDLIRFEPHQFLRARPDLRGQIPYHPSNTDPMFTDRTDTGAWSYRGSETNRAALGRAMALDPLAAVEATSFGAFQVMGWALLPEGGGALSVMNAVPALAAFDRDPVGVSERMLVRWVEANPPAKAAARDRKWVNFAAIYNGSGKAEKYGGKIARAWSSSKIPIIA
jgi:hypothetical protein